MNHQWRPPQPVVAEAGDLPEAVLENPQLEQVDFSLKLEKIVHKSIVFHMTELKIPGNRDVVPLFFNMKTEVPQHRRKRNEEISYIVENLRLGSCVPCQKRYQHFYDWWNDSICRETCPTTGKVQCFFVQPTFTPRRKNIGTQNIMGAISFPNGHHFIIPGKVCLLEQCKEE